MVQVDGFSLDAQNCGQNQVIIAENELPEKLDYSRVNLITFSQEEGEGLRYGFLKTHQV